MATGARNSPTDIAERQRLDAAASLSPLKRAALGQFFTPAAAARLIASLLPDLERQKVRLLDSGAGVGSLTAAAIERFVELGVRELEIVAYEIDESLQSALRTTLAKSERWASSRKLTISWEIREADYIQSSVGVLSGDIDGQFEPFDAIITNPPYRKIGAGSPEREALGRLGLPITNLYSAFLALGAAQLAPGGALAAITPRSFANGRYYAPFRRFFFDLVGIESIHVFDSRTRVFADAKVLQENIIFLARRDLRPATVRISNSQGADDHLKTRLVPLEQIIQPGDREQFLRIPSNDDDAKIAEIMTSLPASLEDLEISVSTGKVVEFRARRHLRVAPETGAAPLIRANHLKAGKVAWPAVGAKKPNALSIDRTSERLLLPNENYVLVKRLTSKEESRRVLAAVSSPSLVPGQWVAFENHLNVFHRCQRGLKEHLASGLAAYLNSSIVDRYVRQFNGHTQVNATDLRHLRFPSASQLESLGGEMPPDIERTQVELDEIVDSILMESTSPLRRAA
jgi:adenine-specific DNA-methyltransferase